MILRVTSTVICLQGILKTWERGASANERRTACQYRPQSSGFELLMIIIIICTVSKHGDVWGKVEAAVFIRK